MQNTGATTHSMRFVFIYIKIKFNVNELFIKNFFQKIRAFFIEIFKNN